MSPSQLRSAGFDMTGSPLVSVIIPSLDGVRGGNVERLRRQIASQTCQDTEFVVVKGVRPNGRARNVGVSQTKGDFVLFIDDDVQLGCDDLIEKMLNAFEADQRIALVGVSQRIPEDASAFAKACGEQLERFEAPILEQIEDTDFASHTCMMMRRVTYLEIGGESDILPRGTDPDLRHRLRDAGYRVVLAPGAWAYHPPPENWRQLWRTYFRNGAGSAFVWRHFPDYSIDTAPKHQQGTVGKRPLGTRALGYLGRFLGSLLSLSFISLTALIAYGCGFLKTLLFDRQRWAIAIRRLAKYCLLPLGLLQCAAGEILGQRQGKALRILLYHRVDRIRKYPLVVEAERFRRQMEYLQENYFCAPLSEALLELSAGNLQKETIAITFDDGYLDNYSEAFPVLKEFGLVATVYPVTDYIESNEELPWLKKLGSPTYKMLDWEQLIELERAGWGVEPHTATHPSLGTLSREEQGDEIQRSIHAIEDRLGYRPRNFCYPYGTRSDYSAVTVKLLKEKGIESAVTAVAGLNYPTTQPYSLRRTAIDPSDDDFLFRCHLKGYLDLLAWKDSRPVGWLKRFLRSKAGI